MQRDRFAVPLGGPDTSQTELVLQNQTAFDDEDFLDNGKHISTGSEEDWIAISERTY
jgi:hypothetical protein